VSLIAPPDPTWPAQAQVEADRWRGADLAGLIAVHHIGSTSVPGLPAMPIIDLLPEFVDEAAMDAARPRIEALGYEWLAEFGLPGRRYCRRDDTASGKRLVQAHCYAKGSSEITRHLAFRDALRANAPLRAAYSAVKGKCAALHPGDHQAYGACKSPWIEKAEARAVADYLQKKDRPL